MDRRVFHIRHIGKVLPGYEYCFTIPHQKFKDIDGHLNDSLDIKIKLPDDDELSCIIFNIHGTVPGIDYIVDLMTEKMDRTLRSYIISNDTSLNFPYLKEGTYCLRISEDKNRNGIVDTGDLLAHRQPERVRLLELSGGSSLINIPASTELTQDVFLDRMFK